MSLASLVPTIGHFFYALLIGLSTLSAQAATLPVAPPPASIQAVIDVALPGDTVQLDSGTYIEEIYINKDITLKGNGIDVSIIQCPTLPNPLTNSYVFTPTGASYHPFVLVENTSNAVIEDLTIDGNSQASNFLSYRFIGIAYHNAGGTVQNVRATNVQDSSPAGPTQHGFGIAGAVDDSNSYTLNILNNFVDNFQKAGIDVRGNTLVAQISNNSVIGETPSSTANANGIVVQFGAQALIDSNIVNNLLSTVVGNDAVSILLNNAGANCSVTNNTTNDSDLGIYSNNAGDNLVISSNIVSNNNDIGIYVQDTNGLSTLQNNVLTDNINTNMYLIDTVANNTFQLGGNTLNGSDVGLLVQGSVASGPVVLMNADALVGSGSYYIQEVDAPNDIWPSSANVSFDGLVSGSITVAEYDAIRTKILDQQSPVPNPSLGLVLDYIEPEAPEAPASFNGTVTRLGCCCNVSATWTASPSADVASYNIYNGTQLIKSVSAAASYIFIRSCVTPFRLCDYSITALSSLGVESAATPIVLDSDPGDNCECSI